MSSQENGWLPLDFVICDVKLYTCLDTNAHLSLVCAPGLYSMLKLTAPLVEGKHPEHQNSGALKTMIKLSGMSGLQTV